VLLFVQHLSMHQLLQEHPASVSSSMQLLEMQTLCQFGKRTDTFDTKIAIRYGRTSRGIDSNKPGKTIVHQLTLEELGKGMGMYGCLGEEGVANDILNPTRN